MKAKFVLVDDKTGNIISIGSKVENYRGETVIVRGIIPPSRPGSTSGLVSLSYGEFPPENRYPGVIGAKIMLIEERPLCRQSDGAFLRAATPEECIESDEAALLDQDQGIIQAEVDGEMVWAYVMAEEWMCEFEEGGQGQ